MSYRKYLMPSDEPPSELYKATEVGTDAISRQAAIDAMAELQGRASTKAELKGISKAWKRIEQLPPIQPDNNLQKLADEIASFKRCVKSENSDYLTGYLCALSVVEGMIAERREVTT